MEKLKIGVVIGSTRPNRFADKPAEWIKGVAEQRGDFAVETVDLRDYPMPFFDEATSPAWGPSQDEAAKAWQRKVNEFDGFIITAAEYNRGPTGVLKNAIDYAYNEWRNKPVTYVGYGGVGGARAVEQLRLNAVELQMAPIRQAVHIMFPEMVAVREGKPLAEFDHLNKAAEATIVQLAWWAHALKAARDAELQAKAA